jgi:hypothetical protein
MLHLAKCRRVLECLYAARNARHARTRGGTVLVFSYIELHLTMDTGDTNLNRYARSQDTHGGSGMRNSRIAWIALSVIFAPPGAYVVYDAIYRPGKLAEAEALLGATLIGLAVFAIYMAIEQHRLCRALAKHMTNPQQ